MQCIVLPCVTNTVHCSVVHAILICKMNSIVHDSNPICKQCSTVQQRKVHGILICKQCISVHSTHSNCCKQCSGEVEQSPWPDPRAAINHSLVPLLLLLLLFQASSSFLASLSSPPSPALPIPLLCCVILTDISHSSFFLQHFSFYGGWPA